VPAYDLTLRHLAQEFPHDIAFLSLGIKVDEIENLNPDLPAIEQHADWLAKAKLGREIALIQGEFQSNYRAHKRRRMLSYRVKATDVHLLPVLSVMILLTKKGYPGRGHNVLKESAFGHLQLAFQWHEVRLWELDPEVMLKEGGVGLIPLVPLMKGRGKQPLAKALAAASRVSDNLLRADVLTAVAVIGSLRYSRDLIKQLIRSDAMKESPIYQEILQEGRAEGRMEGARRIIGRTLRSRFTTIPAQVRTRLGKVRSLERLEELAEHAVKCRTLAAFSKLLP